MRIKVRFSLWMFFLQMRGVWSGWEFVSSSPSILLRILSSICILWSLLLCSFSYFLLYILSFEPVTFYTTTMLIGQIHCHKKSYGLINLNDQRQFNLSNTLIKEIMVHEWFIYFFSWPKVYFLIRSPKSGEQNLQLKWRLPLSCVKI